MRSSTQRHAEAHRLCRRLVHCVSIRDEEQLAARYVARDPQPAPLLCSVHGTHHPIRWTPVGVRMMRIRHFSPQNACVVITAYTFCSDEDVSIPQPGPDIATWLEACTGRLWHPTCLSFPVLDQSIPYTVSWASATHPASGTALRARRGLQTAGEWCRSTSSARRVGPAPRPAAPAATAAPHRLRHGLAPAAMAICPSVIAPAQTRSSRCCNRQL